ncbi:amino acid adenylation domain-containing protein [Micromonospora sp. URMC 107]|uniref:amino acid adenylation domain-containing protein n=1 Tax=Micromonospora sp. URMC 107 TaxID=3423418 RepID=UPI003F1DF037
MSPAATARSADAVLNRPAAVGAAAVLAGFAFVARKYVGGARDLIVAGEPAALTVTGDDTLAALSAWAGARGGELTANAPGCGLHLTVTGRGGDTVVRVTADEGTEEFATRACGHVLRAARAVLERPDLRLRELDVLGEDERELIRGRFNDTARAYPCDATVHGLFAEQARLRPDSPAVVAPEGTLTYAELDHHARRVAGRLVAAGVGPGDLVAVSAGKSSGPIAAILGVLMAGAAYVPIDPSYPPARRDLLIRDSGARVLLTAGEPATDLPDGLTLIDVTGAAGTAAQPAPGAATDVAYVMYTSGTTGVPKGALITHRGVVRLVRDVRYVALTPATRMLQASAAGFDATTFETWGALLNGGALVLVPNHVVLDPVALGAALRDREVTTAFISTALFHQLAEQDATVFRPLVELVVGGDALSARHADLVLAACPGLRLVNGYGPTENTTFSTVYPVDRAHPARVPIGSPVPNSTAYVVDLDGHLQPVGVPGELLVGGDGVSLGYLRRPEQTARAFVPDRFGAGDRLYRTGDRARWLPDGNLDFLGRIDDQVKIRGFRVEPGEVEQHLGRLPGVLSVAVLVETGAGGARSLTAYLTADEELTARQLRAALRATLPEHMIPARFVQVAAMPLTAHGKTDRRRLARGEYPVSPGSPGR